MPFRTVVVLIVVTIAMLMDLKKSCIDNCWIVLSGIAGFLLNVYEQGIQGLVNSFVGAVLPLLILFGIFYFRMLGAGDIKLLCVLGVLQGPKQILYCLGYSFLSGAIMSLAILIYTGSMRQRVTYLIGYFSDYFRTGTRKSYLIKDMDRIENFHFTVPILMSVMLYAGGIY